MDWLFEGHLSVYLLLAAAAALCVVVWVKTRKRRWLAVALVPIALAGLYCLLDFAVETDREQITRKVHALAAGFKAPANLDAVFQNVSDEFHNSNSDMADKATLRMKAQENIQQWAITEVRLSDLQVEDISREKKTALVGFRAKVVGSFPNGPDAFTVHCDASFDYDPTHGWRMRGLGVQGEPPIQFFQIPP